MLGTIDNSHGKSYGYDNRVTVFGAAGAVTVSNETPDEITLSYSQGIYATLPTVTGQDGRIPVVIGLAAKKSLVEHRSVRANEID